MARARQELKGKSKRLLDLESFYEISEISHEDSKGPEKGVSNTNPHPALG